MLTRRTVVKIWGGLATMAAVTATVSVGEIASAQPRAGKAQVFTDIVKGVAVGGYDPVAYFTDGKPVKGRADITLRHEGAEWRFASAANRDAFRSEPARYSPQYGGYCAWAVASGYTAKGDPDAWTIADGKLYLNYNKSVQKNWEKDIAGNVRKGDANWPKVLEK